MSANTDMAAETADSPAWLVMKEAIELAIEGRSPYPERAAFLNEDWPNTADSIKRAFDDGMAVVLVSSDGTPRVLLPERAADG